LKVLRGLNREVLEFVHFEQGMCRALSDAMSGARHFRELVCWQLAIELKLGLYRLSEQPEVRRDLRFCDQLRDAAASAPRNIAEGFRRRSHADFARFSTSRAVRSPNPRTICRMLLIVDTWMNGNSSD
jgi:hypothetical protein